MINPIQKISVLVLTIGLAASASAERVIEEIIVTAQKRAESANDIGITMNAFTGERLRDLGVDSAEDLALYTPSLTVSDTAATGVPLYTIRGVGFQDYSTAASSTVGLYFDEAAIPYTVMSRGALFDVERVEVLKGPQGDLYGRNTTAGQINFVSNKPTEEFEAGISASYGTYQTFDVEGFVSGSISDAVNGRFAFKSTQSGEGWQKSLTRNDELGEQDVQAFRGMLNIDLSENAELLLSALYVDDQSENSAPTAYSGAEIGIGEFSAPYVALGDYILPTGANFGDTPPWYSTDNNEKADWTNSYTSPITGRTFDLRPQRDNQLKSYRAKLTWDIGNNMTLTTVTAFDDFQRAESNDWDGGFYNDSSNINTTDLEVFSQEVRLAGETENTVWIVGGYYSDDTVDEYYHYFMSDSVYGLGSVTFGVPPFVLAPILELDTKYEQETTSKAVFGHLEWSLTDDWRLTLGARYTEEEREWSGCTFSADDNSLGNFLNTLFGSTVGPGDCGTIDDDPNSPTFLFALIGGPNVNDAFHVYTETINTSRWMGKIGVDYSVNDDVLLYATYSTGFKSGGFNGANSNTTRQLNPYKEEILNSLELGVKATLLNGAMQLNAAAFTYDYRDKQEQDRAVTFVGNISGLTNISKSEIDGWELEMNWLPTDNFSVDLGIAWLDTNIKKFNQVDTANSAWPVIVYMDGSGQELAQSPEWQYNGTATYEWALNDNFIMSIAGDLSYKDDTQGLRTQVYSEDYLILGARVVLMPQDGQWRAMLWSRNVTDEDYFPSAHTGGNGPYVRRMGMPRTVGVTLDYNF